VEIGLDELTGTEQAVLLVLLAEARPVPNPELGRLGPELRKDSRDNLNRKGLIDSVQEGRVWVHELTDKGGALCRQLFGADAPERSSGQGKALYTLLRGLQRYMTRMDVPPVDIFAPTANDEDAPPDAGPADEQQVRDAYLRLARQPGDWVGLLRLRAELPDVAHPDFDDRLRRMYRKPGVHVIPEENQKVLTEDDRRAAVVIGDQPKHLIAIDA